MVARWSRFGSSPIRATGVETATKNTPIDSQLQIVPKAAVFNVVVIFKICPMKFLEFRRNKPLNVNKV